MAKRKRATQYPVASDPHENEYQDLAGWHKKLPTLAQLQGLPKGVGPGTTNDMGVVTPPNIYNGMNGSNSIDAEQKRTAYRNMLDKWGQDTMGINPQTGDKVLPLSGLGKGVPPQPQLVPSHVPSGVGPGTRNNMHPDYMNQSYLMDKQLPLQGLPDPNLPTGWNYDGSYSRANPPPLNRNQNPYPDSRVLKPRPPFLVR